MSALTLKIRESNFLVIDPVNFQRSLTCEALRAVGATSLESVPDFADALDRIRSFTPTIVLYEWNLSLMNGLEFTRAVRSGTTPLKPDIGMIMVTSRSTLDEVEEARRAGVDEYLIKPFATQGLLNRVREVLFNRRKFVKSSVYTGPCRRRKFLMDYDGPKRRLFDEDTEPTGNEAEIKLKRSLAKAKVTETLNIARKLTPGDRTKIRETHSFAKQLVSLGKDMEDKLFLVAAESMMEYIEGVGASPRFDPKVIEAHADTMQQLLSLPMIDEGTRQTVAAALQTLVKKKLAR